MRSASAVLSRFSLTPLSLAVGTVAVLALAYIALIAVTMSYVALTIEFSESVRNDEAAVAALESSYLGAVGAITTTDYVAQGYARPERESFVRQVSGTALR